MNLKNLFIPSVALLLALSSCGQVSRLIGGGASGPTAVPLVASTPLPAAAGDTTPRVVAAAEKFLATLDATQRGKTVFALTDTAQKQKWSNFPTGIFQRNGLKFGEMTPAQREAALALVASALSTKGYEQIINQVNADEVLKGTDGGNLMFGQAEYYISILGTPSANMASPWILQFGGHHMALNVTVVGSNITLAPSLTGGQPAEYTLNGQAVRTIGIEVDKSFALVNALNAEQQKQAVVGTGIIDLVTGPGQDGKKIQPTGIKVSTLTPAQQTLLLDLIHERVNILNDEDTALKMAEIKANLADTYFMWSGPTTVGSAAYHRIQGPTVLIEYSPQQMGGSAASATNHIHSMYRDPSNDYGAKWIKP